MPVAEGRLLCTPCIPSSGEIPPQNHTLPPQMAFVNQAPAPVQKQRAQPPSHQKVQRRPCPSLAYVALPTRGQAEEEEAATARSRGDHVAMVQLQLRLFPQAGKGGPGRWSQSPDSGALPPFLYRVHR